jgi:D-3-phosphoglycerate dehydrogenase
MKIVLAEKVSPATLAVFAGEGGWQIVTHDQLKNGLAAELADADALVVRSAVQVDEALLSSAPKLRVIGRAGVGVDNIDAEAATRRGIVVMNTPGANAIAVAELTIALMLALGRQLPRANALLHAGKWEKKSLQGTELRGKQLGILGLGRVGLEVARRAKAFGMELLGHDPFVAPAVARENGVRLCSVDELFRTADYLTLHVGLTPQTAGIINARSLAGMKKNARIGGGPELRSDRRGSPGCVQPGAVKGFSVLRPGQRDPHSAHCRVYRRGPGSGWSADRHAGQGVPQVRGGAERR